MLSASACACSRISETICAPCSRASSRIRAASWRASASWALYFSSAALASSWASLASFIPPSIADVRAAYAFSKLGTTNFQTSPTRIKKTTMTRMSSDVCTARGCGSSAARCISLIAWIVIPWPAFSSDGVVSLGERTGQHERKRDADDGERLREREPEYRDGLQSRLSLGLAGDTVDVRGEDQTDTDTWPNGSQAVPDHVERASHGFSFRRDACASMVKLVLGLVRWISARRRARRRRTWR